jgi:glycerol-3-phosphate acyltransferase PlsY
MIALSAVIGYLLGSLPTANAVARLWGVDLRSSGSGNPGANNARQLGGYPLAAAVLGLEVVKGIVAVWVGFALAGDGGAVASGVGAVAGNVYNIWYRFEGGKGLGIAAGVLLAAWPWALPILLGVLVVVVKATRSSGKATLAGLAACLALAILWWAMDLPAGWGVNPGPMLLYLAIGLTVVMLPKHLHDARFPITEPGRL